MKLTSLRFTVLLRTRDPHPIVCPLCSGALVHVLHRPAAEIWVVERVQRGHQVEHVRRHHLSEPDVHNAAHQLQQLQAANEQQGLDLRQVRTARELIHGEEMQNISMLLDGDGSSLSSRCNQCASVCAVCHHVVKGLFVWCQGCSHGGHLEHIMNWLKSNAHCPAGCGHLCEYTWKQGNRSRGWCEDEEEEKEEEEEEEGGCLNVLFLPQHDIFKTIYYNLFTGWVWHL